MTIIERIIAIMEIKGIKQQELAEKLNINKSVVSNWKRQKKNPPAEYIPDIAELLNESTSYILTGQQGTGYKLTSDEERLIRLFRVSTDKDKQTILTLATSLSDEKLHSIDGQKLLNLLIG